MTNTGGMDVRSVARGIVSATQDDLDSLDTLIEEAEASLTGLREFRKVLAKKVNGSAKKQRRARVGGSGDRAHNSASGPGRETEVYDYVREHGPATCGVIAGKLGTAAVAVGKAVSGSDRLRKNDDGLVELIDG